MELFGKSPQEQAQQRLMHEQNAVIIKSKVEEKSSIEEVFETEEDKKVDSRCHKLGCGHARKNPKGICCMVPVEEKPKEETLSNKVSEILDGDLQGNWKFTCLEKQPCCCQGNCEEFSKLKKQIIDLVEDTKETEALSMQYLKKIIEVIDNATILQSKPALRAVRALCEECLQNNDLAHFGDNGFSKAPKP